MTLEQVRNKIAESNDFNWFNSVQTNVSYPHLKFSVSLTGITAIYEFISNQTNGWSKKGENIPNELKTSRDFFQKIQTRLIELLNQANQNIRENIWTDIRTQLESGKKYFIFESPEVDFLIKIFSELPDSFGSAYSFVLGTVSGS